MEQPGGARIREARPGDVADLVALRAALWPEGTPAEHRREVEAVLATGRSGPYPLVVFVAELVTGAGTDHAGLVGFAEVGLRSHAEGCDPRHPVGFLEGWYVRPEARGRGVGRALLTRAETWALDLGCHELASDTWIDNDASRRAHEALGFEVVDRCIHFRKRLVGDG